MTITDLTAIAALFPQPLLNALVLVIGALIIRIDRRQALLTGELAATRKDVFALLRAAKIRPSFESDDV